jgi:hypothetical protein
MLDYRTLSYEELRAYEINSPLDTPVYIRSVEELKRREMREARWTSAIGIVFNFIAKVLPWKWLSREPRFYSLR